MEFIFFLLQPSIVWKMLLEAVLESILYVFELALHKALDAPEQGSYYLTNAWIIRYRAS